MLEPVRAISYASNGSTTVEPGEEIKSAGSRAEEETRRARELSMNEIRIVDEASETHDPQENGAVAEAPSSSLASRSPHRAAIV